MTGKWLGKETGTAVSRLGLWSPSTSIDVLHKKDARCQTIRLIRLNILS